MSLDPRTPVIVGVGQQLQRVDNPLEALAPVPFIANAIREATKDAGLSSVPNADSIRVISFLSWRYRDPARYIAEELGITTRETVVSSMGGNSTQSMINATALEIQSGDFDVVILCGGETSRTRKRARAADIELPWPVVPEDVKPTRWRACKDLTEFAPFWGTKVRRKNSGLVTWIIHLQQSGGCSLGHWFDNYETLDGKPLGIEEVIEPS
jgi:acetyl-CoA C-acetyltransferase